MNKHSIIIRVLLSFYNVFVYGICDILATITSVAIKRPMRECRHNRASSVGTGQCFFLLPLTRKACVISNVIILTNLFDVCGEILTRNKYVYDVILTYLKFAFFWLYKGNQYEFLTHPKIKGLDGGLEPPTSGLPVHCFDFRMRKEFVLISFIKPEERKL